VGLLSVAWLGKGNTITCGLLLGEGPKGYQNVMSKICTLQFLTCSCCATGGDSSVFIELIVAAVFAGGTEATPAPSLLLVAEEYPLILVNREAMTHDYEGVLLADALVVVVFFSTSLSVLDPSSLG